MTQEEKEKRRKARQQDLHDMQTASHLIDPEFSKYYGSINSALEVFRSFFFNLIFGHITCKYKIDKLVADVETLKRQQLQQQSKPQISKQLDEREKIH
jgi:hypothetical protein